MGDDLAVTVGGTTVVVEELREEAARLGPIASDLGGLRARVAVVEQADAFGWASSLRWLAGDDLSDACVALAEAETRARALSWSLSVAATGYEGAEHAIQWTLGALADQAGAIAGGAAPVLLGLAATNPGLALAALLGAALLGGTAFRALGEEGRARLVSQPAVVAAIRFAVRGSDDAMLGLAGLPPAVTGVLGEHGLGLTGLATTASAVSAAARPHGWLREGPVRVAERIPLPAVPPADGFEARFARVPDPDRLDGAQVVVERYETPDGRARFEVYIAGTVDFDPGAVGEPWDMASNVTNAIGPGSGSYDSVVAALREAGVGADDPVQFTGYSQGGATAALLAASGEFATAGLVTFGGPTGQIAVPSDIPAVLVEHTDDLVPALGGMQENASAVVVSRWATRDADLADAAILPAHRRPAYAETASLMGASTEPRLVDAARRIDAFTDGAVLVERTAYRCERDAPAPATS